MYTKDMKTLEGITLVFENCETAYIPINEVAGFGVCDVYENFFLCNTNKSLYSKRSKYFGIAFKDLKNLSYENIMGNTPEQRSLFDRITSHRDITHVEIHYLNEPNEYIAVPWKGKLYTNHMQIFRKRKYYKKIEYDIIITNKWTIKKIINYTLYGWKVLRFYLNKRNIYLKFKRK